MLVQCREANIPILYPLPSDVPDLLVERHLTRLICLLIITK